MSTRKEVYISAEFEGKEIFFELTNSQIYGGDQDLMVPYVWEKGGRVFPGRF